MSIDEMTDREILDAIRKGMEDTARLFDKRQPKAAAKALRGVAGKSRRFPQSSVLSPQNIPPGELRRRS